MDLRHILTNAVVVNVITVVIMLHLHSCKVRLH